MINPFPGHPNPGDSLYQDSSRHSVSVQTSFLQRAQHCFRRVVACQGMIVEIALQLLLGGLILPLEKTDIQRVFETGGFIWTALIAGSFASRSRCNFFL